MSDKLITSVAQQIATPYYGSVMTGLRNYWKLEGNANDSLTGYTTNGTIYSGSTITGKNNNGININTNGYINMTNNGSTNFALQNFTINMWVYANTATIANKVLWSYDFTSQASPYYSQHLRTVSNGGLVFYTNYLSGATPTLLSMSAIDIIPTYTWFMVSITSTGGVNKIYFNSVLKRTTTGNTITYYNTPLNIGKSANVNFNAVDFYFDEVGFWGRALSNEELQYLYLNSNGRFYS